MKRTIKKTTTKDADSKIWDALKSAEADHVQPGTTADLVKAVIETIGQARFSHIPLGRLIMTVRAVLDLLPGIEADSQPVRVKGTSWLTRRFENF